MVDHRTNGPRNFFKSPERMKRRNINRNEGRKRHKIESYLHIKVLRVSSLLKPLLNINLGCYQTKELYENDVVYKSGNDHPKNQQNLSNKYHLQL